MLYGLVAALQEPRVISTGADEHFLTDEAGVIELIKNGVRFMDITNGPLNPAFAPVPPAIPSEISQQRELQIRHLVKMISLQRLKRNLTKFTSFHTRYYKSEHGLAAAEWLFERIGQITRDSRHKVHIHKVHHEGWPQFSIICRLQEPDQEASSDKERVVLSAHLDSITTVLPAVMPAPGADDDGSGVVTLLEVIRLVTRGRVTLHCPLEFIFYSAEEVGLLGSQEVVRQYQIEGIPASVLHIDMVGYAKTTRSRRPSVGIIRDHTDEGLSRLVAALAKNYTFFDVQWTECGYACSDHASWTMAGYPATALFEGSFEDHSPFIHTSLDTVANINFDHMREFVKVALAYAIHMTSGPVGQVGADN